MAAGLSLSANAFSRCAPVITTTLGRCGTVTQCNAVGLTSDEIETIFLTEDGDPRIMNALFQANMEIKMCEAEQNGLYDFIMANRRDWSGRRSQIAIPAGKGRLDIMPFIKARQYTPINDKWWQVATGGSYDSPTLTCSVSCPGVPADVRYFPERLRVHITGTSEAGATTHTSWEIATSTISDDGESVTLELTSQNAGSNMDADKVGAPTTGGLLVLGTPNVNDYEKWCAEMPVVNNRNMVPFWVEDIRDYRCKSELFDTFKQLALEGNDAYKEYWDIDEVEINKQLSTSWQNRMVNSFFYNTPRENQTLAAYDQLEEITTYDGDIFGVDGAKCVGKRANSVGVLEQLAECDRVVDLLGEDLNFPALFEELYNMYRIRKANGHPQPMVFDLFTDSVYAEKFNQGMIAYYVDKSQDKLQFTYDVKSSPIKKAEFGFFYQSYTLGWPRGLTINVITHDYFDDLASAGSLIGQEQQNRVLWILDFRGIYMAELASGRYTPRSGTAEELARIDPNFLCVPKAPGRSVVMTTAKVATIVDCPRGNLVLENIGSGVPDIVADPDISYPATTTSTTTTAAT